MAKRMSDEQKLFFGTHAQRLAMAKKHPGWAKDKAGFRQTVRGHRNPVKKLLAHVRSKVSRASRPRSSGSPAAGSTLLTTFKARAGGGGSTGWGVPPGQPLVLDDKQTVAYINSLNNKPVTIPAMQDQEVFDVIKASNEAYFDANPGIYEQIIDPNSVYNQSFGGW